MGEGLWGIIFSFNGTFTWDGFNVEGSSSGVWGWFSKAHLMVMVAWSSNLKLGRFIFSATFMVNDGVEELPLTRHFPGLVGSVRDVQHLIRFVSMRSTIPDQVLGWWGRSRRGKKAPEDRSSLPYNIAAVDHPDIMIASILFE